MNPNLIHCFIALAGLIVGAWANNIFWCRRAFNQGKRIGIHVGWHRCRRKVLRRWNDSNALAQLLSEEGGAE